MPQLLEEGYVYVAETPLYEIVMNKNESIFAYTDEERDAKLAQLEKEERKFQRINRSKGLGENMPEMLWNTTMNPKTRHLKQLQMNPEDEIVIAYTDMLFGKDKNKLRKGYIFEKLEEEGIDEIFD